jgi:hypothetical protein
MTAALKLAAEKTEEEADSMDFADLCEELEALEKRVIVQGMHIQQIKWETKGKFQSEEQLEEAGDIPATKMASIELPQGEAKR